MQPKDRAELKKRIANDPQLAKSAEIREAMFEDQQRGASADIAKVPGSLADHPTHVYESSKDTGRPRLPGYAETKDGKGGLWSGEPGNSDFTPNNEKARNITNHEPVPYKDGRPDFSQWSRAEVIISDADGGKKDFDKANHVLAQQWARREGGDWRGRVDPDRASRFMAQNDLVWHHADEKGNRLQAIPKDLHANVPHKGPPEIAQARAETRRPPAQSPAPHPRRPPPGYPEDQTRDFGAEKPPVTKGR